MKFAALTALALASGAYAQNLTAALAANPQLSALLGLLSSPGVQLPSNLTNVTLLAPSNSAIGMIPNATLQGLAANATLLNNVLLYHILRGNYSTIPNATFIPTLLQQSVTGGQRVHAMPGTNSTTFYTGLLANSSTVNSTIPFSGGSIHIINSLLTPPVSVSVSAVALNLTSAVGALTAANLASTVDTTSDLTVFVPNNAAFRRIGSALSNISTEQLSAVLRYHVVQGVVYSNAIMNGSMVPTLQGTNITTRIVNGSVYVNNAKVILANVLTSNGVVHVIDSVLNPMNATATSSGNSTADAFAGASSATADVLTSGVPTPTSSINTGAIASGTSRAAGSSTSSGIAALKAVETGAVAVAALFGAVMNL